MKKLTKEFFKNKGIIHSFKRMIVLMLVIVLSLQCVPSFFAQASAWMEDNTVTEPVKEDYAYSFAVVGDPQYIAQYDRKFGGTYLKQMYKWIADNADAHNIQFVLGMGDITHNDALDEWKIADDAISQLDGVVPYTLIRGNHDNRTTFFDQYFGANSDYMKQETIVSYYVPENDASNDYSTIARNTIHEYKIGGVDYLVVALDFGAQDPILEWANAEVAKYPDHNVIVTTHAYIHQNGMLLDDTHGVSPSYYEQTYNERTWNGKTWGELAKLDPTKPFNNGDDIWNKFIKKHANISMVLCGHVLTEDIVRTTTVGDHGNVIDQIVINPQAIDDNGKDNGEAGYTDLTGMVAIFYCSEDGKTMDVRYYSTLKDKYYGEQNQFNFRLNEKAWTHGEGMVFEQGALYAMDEALTVFPKTIETEFSYTKDTANRMVLASYGAGGKQQFAIRTIANQDYIGIFSSQGSFNFDQVKNAGTGYHHYAFTFDAQYAYCYVDGELKQKVEHKWSNIDTFDGVPFTVGGDYRDNNAGFNTAYFKNGSVKSLAMYSDVRTAQEIRMDMNYMAANDENALAMYDFVAAKKDGRAIVNYANENNDLNLEKVAVTGANGMSFAKGADNLYLMKDALTVFPRTIEVNLKGTAPTSNQMIVASYGLGGTTLAVRVVKNSGALSVFYGGESNSVTFDQVVLDGAYHTYAFTFTDTEIICYVDGVEAQRKAKPQGMNLSTIPSAPFGIGGDLRSGNGGAFTAGQIKWVSMYSDVRTAEEIAADAKGKFLPDENALLMVDLTAAKAGQDIPNYADPTNFVYQFGNTKKFTAELNRVAQKFTTIPKTIEAVIQYTGGSNVVLAGNYCSNSYSSYRVKINTSGKVELYTCQNGKSAVQTTFTTVLRPKYYQHIAITFDGTNAYLYINGVLTETVAFAYKDIDFSSSLPMVIGGDYFGTSWGNNWYLKDGGGMKSIALYSDYRTAEEIAESAKRWDVDAMDPCLLAAYNFTGVTNETLVKNEKVGGAPLVATSHKVENETYTDIADFGVHGDVYLNGYEQASTTYRTVSKELWDITTKGETNPNIGIEFRMKSKESNAELKEKMSAAGYTSTLWAFANVRLGYSFIEINLSNDLTSFGIRPANFVNSMYYHPNGGASNVYPYEDGAEYVIRVTRTALDPEVDNGYGAVIRVYIGKVNPTTDMPAEDWDAEPVYEWLALHERNVNSTTNCGISVQTGHINHKADMAHTLIYSSNKHVCKDKDLNHVCDECGKEMGAHAEQTTSHICAYCGKAAGECRDTDTNHACDVCGSVMGTHAEQATSHTCVYCGKAAGECRDTDRNHACDVCGTTLSTCADGDNDHDCDVCGTTLSTCADGDNDHDCDVCGAVLSTCADNNNDHNCDVCGEKVSEHSYGAGVITKPYTCTEDGVKTYTCSICGGEKTEVLPAAHRFENVIHKSATCTEGGWTAHKECAFCDEETPYFVLPPLGHSYTVVDHVVPSTLYEQGYTVYACANGCGTTENRDYTAVLDCVATINGTVKYQTLQEALAAAKAGDTVVINAGAYVLGNFTLPAGVTVEGNGDVIINGTLTNTLNNITIKNIHIKGASAQRWAYAKGDLVFENVTFEATSVYALHFDDITAGTTLTYKDCTIIGWAAMGGSPASCTFDGCTIKGNGSYGVIRTYFDATITDCTFDVSNTNPNDAYQDGIHAVDATITVDNCTNVNGDIKDIVDTAGVGKLVVDGEEIHYHDWTAGETVAPTFDNEGYTPYTCPCGETDKRDVKPAIPVVATIGDVRYASLQEAVNAATASDIIVILIDNNEEITVPAGYQLVKGTDAEGRMVCRLMSAVNVPYIQDGYWWIGGINTGIPATGADGEDGTNGVDGKTPTFKVEGGHLWVSYDNGASWADLGNVKGEDGEDGVDGKPGTDGNPGADGEDGITPEFKVEDGVLYVSYDKGATWTKLADIAGSDGEDGVDGKPGADGNPGADGEDGITPEFKVEDGVLYVSYDKGATWTKLADIAGSDGEDGKPGVDGEDGKDGVDGEDGITPEFKVEDGVLYVSYDKGATWTKLADIAGSDGEDGVDGKPGADGNPGADGEDGITPEFKVEDGVLYVSYDKGATWTKLDDIAGSDGEDGKPGADGEDGKDGVDGEDGKDGVDGAPGKDGVDGEDGKDGVTPLIRINPETHEWEVSYDNGETWTSLGQKAPVVEEEEENTEPSTGNGILAKLANVFSKIAQIFTKFVDMFKNFLYGFIA